MKDLTSTGLRPGLTLYIYLNDPIYSYKQVIFLQIPHQILGLYRWFNMDLSYIKLWGLQCLTSPRSPLMAKCTRQNVLGLVWCHHQYHLLYFWF